jgi:SAM-dependent methyltransferase
VATVPGINFDRVASVYDETRGGQRRGDSFAASIAPWVVGSRVVELGVGTGVIGLGLRRHGIDALGVDLSAGMLTVARDRLGSRVVRADVDRLPLSASVDTAFLVWVLQLVEDPFTTLAEAARVVRPGGHVIAILNHSGYEPGDEIAQAIEGLAPLRARRRHRADRATLTSAAVSGLTLIADDFTPWDEFTGTVTEEIEAIEGRIWSSLFDVDDETWATVVEPVLAQLRALPDPDRPRTRRNRHPLLVWQRT